MIKQLIRSIKDRIDGKRRYNLRLLQTSLDYRSVVGEQWTEVKLIDHASGTSDNICFKLTDHNRFVLRWIEATRQMKNIGEYCTEHRISPYTLLNDILSPKSWCYMWNAPELYESFNKWFMKLGGWKRGIRVDHHADENVVVVQVCNPYGNRYMDAIDMTKYSTSSLTAATVLSLSLMHSERVGHITIDGSRSYCPLETITSRIKQAIELGVDVRHSNGDSTVFFTTANGSVMINKRYTP